MDRMDHGTEHENQTAGLTWLVVGLLVCQFVQPHRVLSDSMKVNLWLGNWAHSSGGQ